MPGSVDSSYPRNKALSAPSSRGLGSGQAARRRRDVWLVPGILRLKVGNRSARSVYHGGIEGDACREAVRRGYAYECALGGGRVGDGCNGGLDGTVMLLVVVASVD